MAQLEFADASRLSHAYILSAQSREEGIRTARRLAAAAVCTASGPVPCMKCRSCRKAARRGQDRSLQPCGKCSVGRDLDPSGAVPAIANLKSLPPSWGGIFSAQKSARIFVAFATRIKS